MKQWNWVLSADLNGRWITTDGIAAVDIQGETIAAELSSDTDSPVSHKIEGSLTGDKVESVVHSPGSGLDDFNLSGWYFESGDDKTLVLTDGSTILGITSGPDSGKKNI